MIARFAVLTLALAALGAALRVPFAEWLLPAWTMQTRLVLGGTVLTDARIARRGADEVIEMKAVAVRAIEKDGAVRMAQVRTTASTLLGHGILHPVLVLALLSLPARGWRHYARLAIAAVPLLALVEAIDIPLVLAEQLYVPDVYATGRMDVDPHWSRFLDAGGRYALCVAAAGAAYSLHGRLARQRGRA